MKFDLHTHSTMSDGSCTPEEVVQRALDAGLDGIALTDHDALDGVDVARAYGEHLGVEVFLGCEVSASWKSDSVHVLGYFMDPENQQLRDELLMIRDERVARAEKMVERLQGLGVGITMEQVRAIAKGPSMARPHVAQALVDLGVVPSTTAAFTEEWIGDNGRAYVAKRALTPTEAVRVIIEAGGSAVIAHPVWIEREHPGESEQLIEECAAAGLAGLEVRHPDQDDEWRARWSALAQRLGLVQTGSSDFHGNEHGPIIGVNWADEDTVAELRARAGGRR
ncbi:MAG TPA: PHP domain-containing protein [Actinomycetota bacterium]|nr:PHP domain-containing protein [Actinomycetota bacterium]